MSIDIIRELRDITGMSFNEIKKALEEAGDDKVKALDILRSKGAAVAQKKSTRITQEGIVDSYIHSTRKVGVILELLCETDFVARNPLFPELSHEICLHIVAMDPASVEELLEQPYIKDQALTIKDFISSYVAKLGENIKVGRFSRLSL